MEGPTGHGPGEDEDDDVLAQWPDYRATRGMEFKRLVRAAAALQALFDDSAIAKAIKRSRNTVSSWWTGATPEPTTLRRLAEATGLDPDELFAYVYRDGPPPKIATLPAAVLSEADEAELRAGERTSSRPQPPRSGTPTGSR